jgi:hypothetical protein
MTAITRSDPIVSPSLTRTSRTIPSAGLGISFCLYIASRTATACPRFTAATAVTGSLTTCPGMGDRISNVPDRAPAERATESR